MAAKIPGAHHVTIPKTGHLSNLEDPEGFNAALNDLEERTVERQRRVYDLIGPALGGRSEEL